MNEVAEALELVLKNHKDLRAGQVMEIVRARLGARDLFGLPDRMLAKELVTMSSETVIQGFLKYRETR